MRMTMILTIALATGFIAACGDRQEATSTEAPASDRAGDEPLFSWDDMAAVRAVEAPTVRAFLSGLDETCVDAAFGDESVARTDFNADGQPDFLLYMSGLVCGGEPIGNAYCGSAGCSHELLVSAGADYALRSIQSVDVEIVEHDGRPAVREPLEGTQVRLLAWNGSEMAEVETAESRARADDVAAIRRVIATLYDPYTYDPESGAPQPEYVESSTLQTAALNQAIARGGDPDVGLGYDPYCACQDFWDVTYSIDDVVLEGDEATVLVLFRNAGGEAQSFFLLMRRTPQGWRVDDITDANGSLRGALAD